MSNYHRSVCHKPGRIVTLLLIYSSLSANDISLPASETGCHLLDPTGRQTQVLLVFHIQQNRWEWKWALLLYMSNSPHKYGKDNLVSNKQHFKGLWGITFKLLWLHVNITTQYINKWDCVATVRKCSFTLSSTFFELWRNTWFFCFS